jgi:hypothetical protein
MAPPEAQVCSSPRALRRRGIGRAAADKISPKDLVEKQSPRPRFPGCRSTIRLAPGPGCPILIAPGFGAIRMGIAQSAILGHVRVREANLLRTNLISMSDSAI